MDNLADYYINLYRNCDALWIHDGNPRRPHARLTSGLHSEGFFNSELVMEDPLLVGSAARDLLNLSHDYGVVLRSFDRVVGPAMGAITLAHDTARHISTMRGERVCRRAYTEKDEYGRMFFKRTSIRADEYVLLVEDVLTTGGSALNAASAVEAAGGVVAPYVLVLVNRSGLTEVHGRKIISLVEHPMATWEPLACPLCKEGSEALLPKQAQNWLLLNAAL